MLFGQMEEGKPNAEVSIDDINANAFHSVLRYAHCTNPKIDIENVVSVKHICRKYQIHSLSKICDSYFDSSLSSESMCSLLNDSLNYKLDEYVANCKDEMDEWLRSTHADFLDSTGFLELDFDAVKLYLNNKQLQDQEYDETVICEEVLKWIDHKTMNEDEKSFDGGSPPQKRRKLNNDLDNACSDEAMERKLLKSRVY